MKPWVKYPRPLSGIQLMAALLMAAPPIAAHCNDFFIRDIQKAKVRGEEIFFIKNHQPFYWLGGFPQIIDSFRGPKSIEVGETVNYRGKSVKVGVIRLIQHHKWTGTDPDVAWLQGDACAFDMVDKSERFESKIRFHYDDCLIGPDEGVFPPEGRLNTLWILVPGCREYVEEPEEEMPPQPQPDAPPQAVPQPPAAPATP